MEIRPVGAELFQADGWRDGHETSSRFSQFVKAFIISVGKPKWKDFLEDLRVWGRMILN
jgi:hypothetical protein